MKKIIKKVLIVLVLLLSVCFTACKSDKDPDVPGPDVPGPENPEITDNEHLGFKCITIKEALDKAKAAGETATEESFNVYGIIKEIKNASYGEMIITDGKDEIYVYGVKGEDGTFFDKLTDAPKKGDEVVLNGKLKTFNDKPEMDKSVLKAFKHNDTTPDNPDKPFVPETTNKLGFDCISVKDALTLATNAGEDGTSETYNLYGTIKTILNPQYGQMILTDGEKEISVFGAKGEDGTDFDKLTDMPLPGDEIVLNGTLQTFNGKEEMGRSTIKAFNHKKVDINPADYKKVSVKGARLEKPDTKVMVEGNVVKITYADKMVANGFYLMDYNEGETIYVYGKNAAIRVKVNDKVTVVGTRTNYLNPKETASATKFNYTGSVQIADSEIYEITKNQPEPDFSKVKASTITELINNANYDEVTGNVVVVNGVISKSVNPGFVNYYINDLDLETGSYCYTANSGADFEYLDEFLGKTCKIVLSVINCKCTDAGIIRRFIPVHVEPTKVTMADNDLTKFIYNSYIKNIFKEEVPMGAEIDLVKTVTNDLFNLDGLTITYSSLNADILGVSDDKITALKQGTGKITVTVKLREATFTDEITISVTKNIAATHTVKEAINSTDNTVVTVKGIVLSSLVNRTGFYLIDETGVIAVTTTSEALEDIHLGDEVIVKGNRIHKKKDTTGDNIIGQSVIADSEILSNTYGNHAYSNTLFDDTKTLADLTKLDVKDDYSTNVYTVKAKVTVVKNQYYTSIQIEDPTDSSITMRLYCSSAKQYSFLEKFDGKVVTLELALCNWNDKKYYTGCIISANDGTTKVMNTLNFPK